MVVQALVLWLALGVDRLFSDPPNRWHPVAWLGRWIGWWGRPAVWPPALQRAAGVGMGVLTVVLFTFPFWFFQTYAPVVFLIIAGPFALKLCLAWRCLEEHVTAVEEALAAGGGREEVGMLVSRETAALTEGEVLSAAYESMTENLTDSIIAPILFFTVFGLGGAACYRAVNTMDAMLGYRDERARLGWFAARADDVLSFLPARFAGLSLLLWFAGQGRAGRALRIFRRDRKKRPGFNGGVTMSLIAGGVGVCLEKKGVYSIGDADRPLAEAGEEIVRAVRGATLIGAVLCTILIMSSALIARQLVPLLS